MTDRAQALLDQVLRLSAEERAHLAHELLASLDDVPDEEVEQAWADEIMRRMARIQREGWKGEDGDVVLERVRRSLHK